MIDRSKCKRMMIRTLSSYEYIERIVIQINHDGTGFYVEKSHEDNFLNNEYFLCLKFKDCKPLPEKRTRTMTVDECVKFLHETPCFTKQYEDGDWMFNRTLSEDTVRDLIEHGEYKLLDGTIGKFEVEEKD